MTYEALVQQHFRSTLSYWEEIYAERTVYGRIYQERARRAIACANGVGLPSGAPVLEIGCGPGVITTAMARTGIAGLAEALGVSAEAAYSRAMEDVPLGRMSTPEDIAGVVAWLLSPDARGVTGQALDVNGGAFMH